MDIGLAIFPESGNFMKFPDHGATRLPWSTCRPRRMVLQRLITSSSVKDLTRGLATRNAAWFKNIPTHGFCRGNLVWKTSTNNVNSENRQSLEENLAVSHPSTPGSVFVRRGMAYKNVAYKKDWYQRRWIETRYYLVYLDIKNHVFI